MAQEEHIGLTYDSSVYLELIALVMQAVNNSARLCLTLLQVSCLHYLRN